MNIQVAICTVGRDSLRHALAALARQTVTPHKLILVNQGPSDLEVGYTGEKVVIHQTVKGLSRARNAAVQAFDGDWLMWFDDDEEPAPDWVEQLGILSSAFRDLAFFGGSMIPPPLMGADEYLDRLYAPGDVELNRETYLRPPVHQPGLHYDLWGGNMAFRSDLVAKVGRFDEMLGAGSGVFPLGEDTDYIMRALSAGFRGMLSPRMTIYHTYGARKRTGKEHQQRLEANAALIWKSRKDPALILPELAEKLQPFSAKGLLLASMTVGMMRGEQKQNHAEMKKVWDQMDKVFKLDYGCLVKQ